jgi:putative transposase
MLSWQCDTRTVSIWTVAGRLKHVAYTGSPEQLKAVATLPVGECDCGVEGWGAVNRPHAA